MFMAAAMRFYPSPLLNPEVIRPPFPRVTQHFIGFVDHLDLGSTGKVIGMQIRMPFPD